MPRFEPLRALTGVAALAALGMALGYARDASLAAVFGASALTDAFFVATIIPAIVVAVSVSGALVPATLPVFGARLADRAQAWRLANALLTWSAALLTLAAILVFVTASKLVTWLAPGLNVETRALAITLTQLGAPLIFLVGLAALLGAFANALGSFRLPALVTVWVNGAAFLAILLLGPRIGIVSALLGMLCGAALQLLIQGASLYQQGWRPKITFAWRHADVRETLRLFIPLAAFVALAQSVPIVERMLGSLFSSGDLSLLAYANKLFQIPGLVISSSLAIILYPRLIRAHAEPARAPEAWNEILTRGVRASFFLTLPLAVWFWFNAAAVTRLLLERGAFSPRDAQTTAALAQLLMLAVVPAGSLLVLTRGLHAQRKMNLALGLGALTTALYIAAAFFAARAFWIARFAACVRRGANFRLRVVCAVCVSRPRLARGVGSFVRCDGGGGRFARDSFMADRAVRTKFLRLGFIGRVEHIVGRRRAVVLRPRGVVGQSRSAPLFFERPRALEKFSA